MPFTRYDSVREAFSVLEHSDPEALHDCITQEAQTNHVLQDALANKKSLTEHVTDVFDEYLSLRAQHKKAFLREQEDINKIVNLNKWPFSENQATYMIKKTNQYELNLVGTLANKAGIAANTAGLITTGAGLFFLGHDTLTEVLQEEFTFANLFYPATPLIIGGVLGIKAGDYINTNVSNQNRIASSMNHALIYDVQPIDAYLQTSKI